ncbi:PRC-barrel domain-containing protein [Afipia sp. TerB]
MTIAKYAAAALLGTALMGGSAFAQSATTPSTSSPSATAPSSTTPAASSQSFSDDWRASKIIGLSVYNESNEKLGSISELVVDKSGKIAAAVIGVGGFLGVGQHDIAVNFDQLKFMDEPVKASTASNTTPAAPGGSGMSGSSSTVGSSTGGSSGSGMSASSKDHWAPDHAVMSGTKDQLKAMPQFKYSDTR